MQQIQYPDGHRFLRAMHAGVFYIEVGPDAGDDSPRSYDAHDGVTVVDQTGKVKHVNCPITKHMATYRRFIDHTSKPGLSAVWVAESGVTAVHFDTHNRFRPVGNDLDPEYTAEEEDYDDEGYEEEEESVFDEDEEEGDPAEEPAEEEEAEPETDEDWFSSKLGKYEVSTAYNDLVTWNDHVVVLGGGESMTRHGSLLLGPTAFSKLVKNKKNLDGYLLTCVRGGTNRLMKLADKDKLLHLMLSADGLTVLVCCKNTAFVIDLDV